MPDDRQRTAPPPVVTSPRDVARITARFPSFRDFVDDALFDPAWGYYSTGRVRFGEGGHYETFPLAIAPFFGRMVAHAAYRCWQRYGRPSAFEVCEIGAGNGQLCLDTLASVDLEAARAGRAWKRFAAVLRYRIVERSPALIARQRAHLGPLATRVTWARADLAMRLASGTPFAACGLVVANEVLDCLAHHQIVQRRDGTPGVVFVIPVRSGHCSAGTAAALGLRAGEQPVPRAALAGVLSRRTASLRFVEVTLPVSAVTGLAGFLRRHVPELYTRRRFPPYFACPGIERLLRHSARLYGSGEALWIDYGDDRRFHLTTPPQRRLFAGPPRSGADVYRAPGRDDITFMVDFSAVESVARDAGYQVVSYGPQQQLAAYSGVALDDDAIDEIVRYRALGWLLALSGIGPERDWRHTALTWQRRRTAGGALTASVQRSLDEFLGRRRSPFKLLVLRR